MLVCGGRDFCDWELLCKTLDAIEVSCLIHGAAPGADATARLWAQERGIPIMEFPANWDFFGNAAGPIRNNAMLHYGSPDLVVAFNGGKGTAHITKQAELKGIPVHYVGT